MATLSEGKEHQKYSEAIRKFALTLRYYSPRAYEYVRSKFSNNLPSDSVIRSWYANSSANGEPGISAEGMQCLARIVEEMRNDGKDFYCSLAYDEMAIKSHVTYSDSKKKFIGFVTYGRGDAEELPVARNALVFMVNGINKPVSFPVAHHFIVSLDAQKKSDLVKEVIGEITKLGAKVIVNTFDGLQTNFTTCKKMGASFDISNFDPVIRTPVDNTEVKVILDACHVIKLMRNYLKSEGTMIDSQNRKIEWAHLVALEECRVKNDLVTHKLTKEHICVDNKMKVRLAAELLSKSTASSLKFLRENGQPGFENCEGTEEFCERMNDFFDIFNTGYKDTLQNNNNNIFKTPLNIDSGNEIFKCLDETAEYVKKLKFQNTNVLDSTKKTGFLGILINIHNLKAIYSELIVTSKLESIPTFHLSQDPLESFFGRVRSKCGFCTNPTIDQFKSAYRIISINSEITSSHFANCADNLDIFTVSSAKKTSSQDVDTEKDIIFEEVSPNDILLDPCKEATIVKIASDIETGIHKANFKCSQCLDVLNENDKISDDVNVLKHIQSPPCHSTVHICKIADKYLNIFMKREYDYNRLFLSVVNAIESQNMYPSTDFSTHPTHEDFFVQHIAEEYIRRKSNYIAESRTLEERMARSKNRLRKIRHFQGK